MSDDLKARIAKWKKGQTAGISPSTVTLLNDCLTRIGDLEWENKLFRDRLKELDTCHPDYGVSLEAAKKRIEELEYTNKLIEKMLRQVCRMPVTGARISCTSATHCELQDDVDAYFNAKEKR